MRGHFCSVSDLDSKLAGVVYEWCFLRAAYSAVEVRESLTASSVHSQRLKQVAPIVLGVALSLGVRSLKDRALIHDHRTGAAFELLAGYESGVRLVRLVASLGAKINHVVLLDAGRGII